MKKMHCFVAFIVVLILLASCAQPTAAPAPAEPTKASEPATEPAAPVANTPEPVLTEQEEWLKAAGLGDYTPDAQDWASIEAAAKLEGSVIVYSNSSRVASAAEAFAALYPEIAMRRNVPWQWIR